MVYILIMKFLNDIYLRILCNHITMCVLVKIIRSLEINVTVRFRRAVAKSSSPKLITSIRDLPRFRKLCNFNLRRPLPVAR